MKNNKLIVYKENILVKIHNFIKRLMGKNKVSSDKEFNENKSISNIPSNVFLENIQIKDNSEKKRIKKLQLQYDNGEIDEDDLSEEDVNKIIKLYEEETEQLNQDTLRRKIHIQNMLKELKYNN